MEPFTLIVWLMIGPRFEEARMDNLAAEECLERLFAIRADRGLTNGECVSPKLRLPRIIRDLTPGDYGPLPGRMRV